ncbi:MAG: DsbA family protein [Methyloceanibacter sp.]
MAKNEKKAAGQSEPAGASGAADRANNLWLYALGAVAAVAVAAGIFLWRDGSTGVAVGDKSNPDLAALMQPGPLPDIVLGKEDAPNTIVEYASMTCPHCATFHKTVLPELKTKYIDTGQARLILREFPLDQLAAQASMIARCAETDRYYPMVGAMFETQEAWAVAGAEGPEKLLQIAKQAGFTKEKFDECIQDKALFDKIVETRTLGHETFGVDSTPSFFVNGKRLTGEQTVAAFEALFSGVAGAAPEGAAGAGGDKDEAPGEAGTPPGE